MNVPWQYRQSCHSPTVKIQTSYSPEKNAFNHCQSSKLFLRIKNLVSKNEFKMKEMHALAIKEREREML